MVRGYLDVLGNVGPERGTNGMELGMEIVLGLSGMKLQS